MNIAIFGATGATGKELVRLALDQDHAVTAVARSPDSLAIQHGRLKTVKADILDPTSVEAAVAGQDAVLSALGTKASLHERHDHSEENHAPDHNLLRHH